MITWLQQFIGRRLHTLVHVSSKSNYILIILFILLFSFFGDASQLPGVLISSRLLIFFWRHFLMGGGGRPSCTFDLTLTASFPWTSGIELNVCFFISGILLKMVLYLLATGSWQLDKCLGSNFSDLFIVKYIPKKYRNNGRYKCNFFCGFFLPFKR